MQSMGRMSLFFLLASLIGCAQGATRQEPDARPLKGPGEACESDDECAGIPCADKVCCNVRCSGTCEACDLPGSLGTCTAIPAGEDPAEECGYLGCDGYYQGWDGNKCYLGTTVAAGQAACNGGRACRTIEDECAGSEPGELGITCDDFCQIPDLGTCQGTSEGACINVDQGTETCGQGACAVTTPRCIDGAPVACQPNMSASTPEVCNSVDDDCDGLIDDDWAEPNESCADYQSMIAITSNQFREYRDLSIYGAGDNDYYRVVAVENDSVCSCGSTSQDEDYQIYLYLTAPAGAGSYMFCTGQTCAGVNDNCVEVPAGMDRTLTWTLDGSCAVNDMYEVYVRIYGKNAPGYQCAPYFFSYEFVTACIP